MASRASDYGLDSRSEPRDEVHYRTRGTRADDRALQLIIVNASPRGLMARCDGSFDPGERIRVRLPVIGGVMAEIRWSLGGRIGCQLETAIAPGLYYPMLAAMTTGR